MTGKCRIECGIEMAEFTSWSDYRSHSKKNTAKVLAAHNEGAYYNKNSFRNVQISRS